MGYLINLPQCEVCGESIVHGEKYCKKHLKTEEKEDTKFFDDSPEED